MTTLELPRFSGHAYGVNLDWIGEDGEMVAHGHVEPRRFVAAANRWSRESAGCALRDETFRSTWIYAELVESVEHLWAVRLPKCDCRPETLGEWGCGRADHDGDPDPDAWALDFGGVTESTPGAFPVTLGQWM